jgi:hexosaminidase
MSIGRFLADHINPATGYGITVQAVNGKLPPGAINLTIDSADVSLGDEGYELIIRPELVQISAYRPAGLFYGIQTLRQMLPPTIEKDSPQPGPWVLPAGTIRDYPRFAWRGAMLDVARHFFSVQDVERFIDLVALYKINHLHLHLTDDQGWRIEIKSWPNLTSIGGSTQVGGGPGGFYTQADYARIVAYAQSRYITIVPEVDMPSHVTAAQASYPILNCSGKSPEIYTSIEVNYSSLCLTSNNSYQFANDVLSELAAITPGPFIHIGGDEASKTSSSSYIEFIQKAQDIIESQGKHLIGWNEIAKANLSTATVVQYWTEDAGYIPRSLQQGNQLIMSPATKAYLDMKYDPSTHIGQNWAGYINVQTAYTWDPVTIVNNVEEKDILGVEAPLWTETIQTIADIEYMTFPRLIGYAEIGWSLQAGRDWEGYRSRLAEQGQRLTALGVNFYRSPEIPWK